MTLFTELDLLPSLQKTLAEKGLVTPTEIQARALPALLAGKSIVGVSETGSGKTLAFALPILHALKTIESETQSVENFAQPRAAIIVPTRDLGEQVSRVFKTFTHATRLRVRAVLGGTTLDIAKRNIDGPFDVLVATPGRLIKLLDRKLIDLSEVRTLVFDEADQMLDKGFLPDATRIAESCRANRQMVLFSATVPSTVQSLIDRLFIGAESIRSKGSHKVVATLTTMNRKVIDGKRWPVLEALLAKPVEGGTVIFTNTREQCDILAELLKKQEMPCLVYRGEMDKVERRANLKRFREGEIGLLISTDLGSRGLDVDHVGRVINYHLPQHLDNYLHRVGRTARAGRKGLVVNLVTERDAPLMAKISQEKPSLRPTLRSAEEQPAVGMIRRRSEKPAFGRSARRSDRAPFKGADRGGRGGSFGRPSARRSEGSSYRDRDSDSRRSERFSSRPSARRAAILPVSDFVQSGNPRPVIRSAVRGAAILPVKASVRSGKPAIRPVVRRAAILPVKGSSHHAVGGKKVIRPVTSRNHRS